VKLRCEIGARAKCQRSPGSPFKELVQLCNRAKKSSESDQLPRVRDSVVLILSQF